MIRTRDWFITCAVLVGAATVGGQSAAAALFQQGLMLERAEGNVQQAIVLYERVIAEFPGDTTTVPQALLHLAQMYDKRNDPRAGRMWSRLATEYASSPYAAEAKRKVAESQSQASGPFRMRSLEGVFGTFAGMNVDSPDGRSIVWPRDNEGGDVMLRSVDTGKDRVLLKLPGRRVTLMSWSADGNRIAMITRAAESKPGPNGVAHDVRLITVQGTQARILATAESGQTSIFWSPDSRTILMHVGALATQTSSDLRIVDAVTGETRKVVLSTPLVGEVAWSQDSKQVALRAVSAPNPMQGNDELWLLSIASGQTRQLKTSLAGANGRINIATGVTKRWTTDGRFLVRQQRSGSARGNANGNLGNAFYFVSSTTGQVTPNCANGPQLQCLTAMTPDGTRLASDPASSRLLLIDPATTSSRRVTTGAADETRPFLSTDGRLLMFTSNPDGVPALYVVPVDRTPAAAPIRISAIGPGVDPLLFSWSADGRVVMDFYQEDTDIYRINMDRNGRSTGAPLRLTQDTRGNFRAMVAPDSRAIAYQTEQGISVMSADGASERPVSSTSARGRLEWRSSDEVILQRGGSAQAASLASLNVKTGTVQSLVDLPSIADRWQYDASRNEIVYVPPPVNGVSTFRAKSLSDGSDRVLATVENKLVAAISFRISPDGRFIAWDRLAGTDTRRVHEMHVMTIDGKDDRSLNVGSEPVGDWRGSGAYSWSPDGRFLLFDGRPGRLMVADVKSGESWPIAGVEDTDTTVWNQAQWSSDGSFVVITRDGWRDDFRLIEGLTYDAVVRLMGVRK